jgi:hypothetical protein
MSDSLQDLHPLISSAAHKHAENLIGLDKIIGNPDAVKSIEDVFKAGAEFMYSLVGNLGPMTITEVKNWPDSSNVTTTGYVKDEQVLVITFKNGKKYSYKDVPVSVWLDLLETKSIGRFIAKEIIQHYEHKEI